MFAYTIKLIWVGGEKEILYLPFRPSYVFTLRILDANHLTLLNRILIIRIQCHQCLSPAFSPNLIDIFRAFLQNTGCLVMQLGQRTWKRCIADSSYWPSSSAAAAKNNEACKMITSGNVNNQTCEQSVGLHCSQTPRVGSIYKPLV